MCIYMCIYMYIYVVYFRSKCSQLTTKIKHTKIKTKTRQITNYTENYKHKLTVMLRNAHRTATYQ